MILIFEDKLGITPAYEDSWASMCMKVGIDHLAVRRFNIWKSPLVRNYKLLIQKGNRKSPGYNPDENIQKAIHMWVWQLIQKYNPEVIVCMDLALLGQVERQWDIATIDNMRGGLYNYFGYPWYIMTPISAIKRVKSSKEIALMNRGATSKAQYDDLYGEESDGDDHDEEGPEQVYFEPYSVPLGHWIFTADLAKLTRIIAEQKA